MHGGDEEPNCAMFRKLHQRVLAISQVPVDKTLRRTRTYLD